jgi:hypothetical protein
MIINLAQRDFVPLSQRWRAGEGETGIASGLIAMDDMFHAR